MKTIGREKQFDEIISILLDMQSGKNSKVHISVIAPVRGGLSTFLVDLLDKSSTQDNHKLLPFYAEIKNGLDVNAVEEPFTNLYKLVCQKIGINLEFDGLISTLLGACDQLQEKKILPVLILDVAEGIREINKSSTSLDQSKHAPLLNRLRSLVNLLNDQDSNLAVVCGWNDVFRGYCGDWAAGDVWQRFSPQFVLWSDFENKNSWKIYRNIINASAIPVNEDCNYPGFPRSGIPVGVILDTVRANVNAVNVDGPFLINLIYERKNQQLNEFKDVSRHSILSQLLLEDKALSYDQIKDFPWLKAYTDITPEGLYVATEQFYSAWEIEPAHSLVSLERQTKQDFEIRPDEIVVDVANGVSQLLFKSNNDIQKIDEYCHFKSSNLQGTFENEEWKPIEATVVVWLGREESDQLFQFIASKLNEYETSSNRTPHSKVLIFVHRSDYPANNLGGRLHSAVQDEANVKKVTYRGLENNVASQKTFPASFCNVRVSLNDVTQLRYLSRDPQRKSDELFSAFSSQFKKHYEHIIRTFPKLSPDMFNPPILLPKLILNSFFAFSTEDLAEQINQSVANTKRLLTKLSKADIIQEKNGNWVWEPFTDKLMETIKNNNKLEDSFFVINSKKLRRDIAECYGVNLITLDQENLKTQSFLNFLDIRVLALKTEFDSMKEQLINIDINDSTIVPPSLGNPRNPESIHEYLIKLVSNIEKLKGRIQEAKKIQTTLKEDLYNLRTNIENLSCDFDCTLLSDKTKLLEKYGANQLKTFESNSQLKTIKKEYDSFISDHNRALRKREITETLAKECLSQIDEQQKKFDKEFKTKIVGTNQESQNNPDPKIIKVKERLENIRKELNDLKNSPNQSADLISQATDKISEKFGNLRADISTLDTYLDNTFSSANQHDKKVDLENTVSVTTQHDKKIEDEKLCVTNSEDGIQQLIEILKSKRKINSMDVELS